MMVSRSIKVVCLSIAGTLLSGQLDAYAGVNGDSDARYFQHVSERAKAGNSSAQVCLAELYAYGIGTTRDTAAEVASLRGAANTGNKQAELMLAELQIAGVGLEKDTEGAKVALQKLFDEGYAPAAVEIGLLYSGNEGVPKDEKKEIDWITKGAALGDYVAQIRLALFYHFGDLVKQDDTKAKDLLNKATSQRIRCWAEFGRWIPYIINGYLVPFSADRGATGNFGIWFAYKDGHAENVRLMGTSGNAAVDEAWLDATRIARLPPWPQDAIEEKNKSLGFWLGGDKLNSDYVQYENALERTIFDGWRAKQHPASIHDENTYVSFDLVGGMASAVFISSPSGDLKDNQDLKDLVLTSKYPSLPEVLAGKPMHFSLPINFSRTTFPGDVSADIPEDFKDAMLKAIHDVAVLPKSVLIHGSDGTGKPRVEFDYEDSKASNVRVVESSNDKDIDAAAVAAVSDAKLPSPPNGLSGKKLHLALTINFGTYTFARDAATQAAPSTATSH